MNINPQEYLFFENLAGVRNWSNTRWLFWGDLIDIKKCNNLGDYSACKSKRAMELVKSVRFYRGNTHFYINGLLREQKNEFSYEDDNNITIEYIKNLDYLFKNWKLNENIISYRGLTTIGFEKLTNTLFEDININLKFFDWGYSSTSLNMEYNYTELRKDESHVILVMKISSEVSAIDTCTISSVTDESELTLDRKIIFRITDIIYKGKRNGIFVVDPEL